MPRISLAHARNGLNYYYPRSPHKRLASSHNQIIQAALCLPRGAPPPRRLPVGGSLHIENPAVDARDLAHLRRLYGALNDEIARAPPARVVPVRLKNTTLSWARVLEMRTD